MPRKVRELIRELERSGFVNRGGKGSHRNLKHMNGVKVTVSGALKDDAKPYQERDVARAIEESQK
ncbi:MAG: type II toxin-antitoxin system HicA family toxin [Planctomycetota bacterium]|jgi:predicted RNA binding protein YcfA (HicA-like mRNA interferase family)|nr:type II toxin-antitoxin system HicA family toxin [Planctomycetota bacterium]